MIGFSLKQTGNIHGCNVRTLKRIIKAMLVAEEIEAPEEVDGKIIYSPKNV